MLPRYFPVGGTCPIWWVKCRGVEFSVGGGREMPSQRTPTLAAHSLTRSGMETRISQSIAIKVIWLYYVLPESLLYFMVLKAFNHFFFKILQKTQEACMVNRT